MSANEIRTRLARASGSTVPIALQLPRRWARPFFDALKFQEIGFPVEGKDHLADVGLIQLDRGLTDRRCWQAMKWPGTPQKTAILGW